MSRLRVGLLSCAHLHVHSYVANLSSHPRTEITGIWDHNEDRAAKFAEANNLTLYKDLEAILEASDAVVICSENTKHTELVEAAARSKKHVLCEKPLVTNHQDAERMTRAVEESGIVFMTAFPCRFSPSFLRIKQRVSNGDIGEIKAICATNRGTCPGGWFTEPELSGGGAMIDHVVHVTDLLRDLLDEDVVKVQAQIGNNMYGKDWDDTAMVTLEFPSGIFATLDSSWSRPTSYKTWGDVTMNIVGEKGLIELDMFGQHIQQFRSNSPTHVAQGFGSDLDGAMVDAFIRGVLDGDPIPTTLHDGLQASRVAIQCYESVRKTRAVPVG